MKNMNNPTSQITKKSIRKRYLAEKRFKWLGIGAVALALTFLTTIFVIIFSNGYSVFWQTQIKLDIDLSEFPTSLSSEVLRQTNFEKMIKQAMRQHFPQVNSRHERRDLRKLISANAQFEIRDAIEEDPDLIGNKISLWVTADDEVDRFAKGRVNTQLPETERRLNNRQIDWINTLKDQDRLRKHFNITFFTAGSSRHPEQAGILSALNGSLLSLLITFFLSFPIGIAAAIYLEEFAPKNKFTDLIEININNLAAVPSIIFGLLGLAVLINFFLLPRSTALVGGIVLALMTLPTIIIASRASIKAVPDSIRQAALGIGASHTQMVFHHVLPLAMPGMLTGSIIGMAQALGETAPLMMIGMVAFIVDIPTNFTDPATALPVQIFMWADSPEQAFIERTAGAIIVLLFILLIMNALAVFFRKKLERRW